MTKRLMAALRPGDYKMERALIEAGGDTAVRDGEGCVPCDHATRDKIVTMLAR